MYIEQHRKSLDNLVSSFGQKAADLRVRLSPREIEVCNLVKNGLANKEIADLLNIALHTVEKHRRIARKKLGVTKKASIYTPTSIPSKTNTKDCYPNSVKFELPQFK